VRESGSAPPSESELSGSKSVSEQLSPARERDWPLSVRGSERRWKIRKKQPGQERRIKKTVQESWSTPPSERALSGSEQHRRSEKRRSEQLQPARERSGLPSANEQRRRQKRSR
jgi:hypothetical protein